MKVLERLKLWTPEQKAEHIVNDLYNARVKLELFDAETGKLKERVEGDNYATDLLLAQIKWFARGWLTGRVAVTSPTNDTSNTTYFDWSYIGPGGSSPTYNTAQRTDYGPNTNGSPQAVILTNDSHAEDATDDRILRGALVAWSYLDGYTGTDTQRGSCNSSESNAGPTKSVFVVDWPTNSGNGTIASVHWAHVDLTAGTGAYADIRDIWMTNNSGSTVPGGTNADTGYGLITLGANPAGFISFNNASYMDKGLALDGSGNWWSLTYNNTSSSCWLVQRAISTGAVGSTIHLSGEDTRYQYVFAMAYDGTNWWVCDGNTASLHKYGPTGTLLQTTTFATLGMPAPGNFSIQCGPMFFGNGYIWIGYNNHYYQINPATPSLVATIGWSTQGGINQSSGMGMYYSDATNGDEIWNIPNVSSVVINRYDLSGNFRGAIIPPYNANLNGIAQSGFTYYAMNSNQSSTTSPDNLLQMTSMRQFLTRTLLPSAVTKANTQTMKLTYEFDYS